MLPGIRSTWKEDLDAAPALLIFGTNLRRPDNFFPSTSAEINLPGQQFCPWSTRKLSQVIAAFSGLSWYSKNIPTTDLMSAEQVYVRHDAHRGPLVQSYNGPFKVLCRSDKHFDILRNNKPTRLSIDTLKPAYCAGPKLPPPTVQPHAQAPHPHAQATRVDDNAGSDTISDTQSITRSGRTIKRPIRYRTILSARLFWIILCTIIRKLVFTEMQHSGGSPVVI